jgi:cell division protein FtsB
MSIIKKITTYLFLGLILLLIINLGKDLYRISRSGERLDQAKEELAELKKENKKLKERQEASKHSFYIEKQIRDKLGMAKPGETVVILPEDINWEQQSRKEQMQTDLPTWKQWFILFK